MGIRLHRAFETASTREEIFANLHDMVLSGELNRGEAEELRAKIEETLNTTVAGEWFDGSWERLYRERKIVSKKRSNESTAGFESKRPDRVMTRGKEAVVIDYKFGREKDSYKDQIAYYMSVLGEMGYTSIKGYIWYVSQEKIVQI
jgi:CRISPR/Cas system-associated exonuclease Cas4 (RecB family)